MTVAISKPAMNLRALLAKLAGMQPAPRRATFYFAGNSALTAFTLPKGWTPVAVYSGGSRKRFGTGNDYTTSFDGFAWTVTFAVAPGVVFIDIDGESQQ